MSYFPLASSHIKRTISNTYATSPKVDELGQVVPEVARVGAHHALVVDALVPHVQGAHVAVAEHDARHAVDA